jgi:hypothetical protein
MAADREAALAYQARWPHTFNAMQYLVMAQQSAAQSCLRTPGPARLDTCHPAPGRLPIPYKTGRFCTFTCIPAYLCLGIDGPDQLRCQVRIHQPHAQHQAHVERRVTIYGLSGELSGARWSEIDEEKKEWRIVAERTKMRKDHISLRRREKQNPVGLTLEPLSYTHSPRHQLHAGEQ